jgi:dihydroorotate dehydrogenase (fumarate)
MNLNTKYLGFRLPNPLIVGSGPLTNDMNTVKQLEDQGAAAIVLRSLYEEEIIQEQMQDFFNTEGHGDSFSEAASYAPDPRTPSGPDEYLEHLRRVKNVVSIPVIASLNGTTTGEWTFFTRLIQEAGADAVELSIYHAASDVSVGGDVVERRMIDIIKEVKQNIRIPVAVKLAPLFTAFTHFALQLDAAEPDGLVLFTRFHSVDIDVLELDVLRSMKVSTPRDFELRLKGAALLAGRVNASLAISGGVHSAMDVIKATMVGAHVTQMVSALMIYGPKHIKAVLAELQNWMEKNEWESLDQMRGNMGFDRIPDPAVYERENYRMISRW